MRPVRTVCAASAAALASTIALSGCTPAHDPEEVVSYESLAPDQLAQRVAEYGEPLAEEWGVPSIAFGVITEDGLQAAWFSGENTAGEPVDSETLFEIGSATKAFLGVSEALLVEDGTMSWDDRVIDHYPDFELHDQWVTEEFRIADLLAQRSGMAPYAADMLGHLGYPYDTAIDALKFVEPATSFRSEFAYQNIPHLVAGKIVAAHEGAPTWGDAARSLLFDPLQMTSTLLGEHALSTSANTTAGHEVWDGEVRTLASGSLPYEAQGAGGIVSNLADMANWVAMHLSGGRTPSGESLLPASSLEETYKPRVAVTGDFAEGMKQGDGMPHIGYATGWLVHSLPEGRVIEHGGTTNGYTSSVRFDPDRGIGVVVLTNLSHQGGLATPIAQYAMDLIQGREPVDYEGRVQEVLAARAAEADDAPGDAPEPDLARLVGSYTHPVAGTIEVVEQNGALTTVIGPREIEASFAPVPGPGSPGEMFELSWLFDNNPDAWHLSAPAVFTGDGEHPEELVIADLIFERD